MPNRTLPSQEYLGECFSYNGQTGELCWKRRPKEHFATHKGWATWNANNAGVRAGNVRTNRYRRILLNRISYLEHRVIWKMLTGIESPETIDHIDGNPSNNAWGNLRAATQLEQKWNASTRSDNKSGHRGVHPVTGTNRWQARISVDGCCRHIGCFATAEEASQAYENAARETHGKFYLQEGRRE